VQDFFTVLFTYLFICIVDYCSAVVLPTSKMSTEFEFDSLFCMIISVVTNSSTYYLNTIANSQEFSLFKIVFQ